MRGRPDRQGRNGQLASSTAWTLPVGCDDITRGKASAGASEDGLLGDDVIVVAEQKMVSRERIVTLTMRPRAISDACAGPHGQMRNNDTRASTADPYARLIRKGKDKGAKLSYLANALMENRRVFWSASTCVMR